MLYADAPLHGNLVHVGLDDISFIVPEDFIWKVTVMHLDGVKAADRERESGFRTAMGEMVEGSMQDCRQHCSRLPSDAIYTWSNSLIFQRIKNYTHIGQAR